MLGIGKTIEEALFKGLVSAGFKLCHPTKQRQVGVYFTINDQDKFEILGLAKKFSDLGLNIYATKGTADTIRTLGVEVTTVDRLSHSEEIFRLMDEGKIDYIVYTGKTDMDSINDYIRMYHHAFCSVLRRSPAWIRRMRLADIIASRFNENNTELVDINHLRTDKLKLNFIKMQSCGNDYIFFDNMDGKITCPESLAINFGRPPLRNRRRRDHAHRKVGRRGCEDAHLQQGRQRGRDGGPTPSAVSRNISSITGL